MNLVQRAVQAGGKLAPIVIPKRFTAGTGLMNPSVFVDDDGEILVNLRHVNYALYHAEHKQRFPSMWGPLAYLHPENNLRLETENYLCRLNSELEMTDYCLVDMLNLHEPIWEFLGLEDARLVQWKGVYYLIGVRRDTTTNGQGRMEYSTISLNKGKWEAREVARKRIAAPNDDPSYCEKNWVPVIDQPFTFVKWTMPTELVHVLPDVEAPTVQVALKQTPPAPLDQRGSSHVFAWGDYLVSITHDVDLFKNYLEQKGAVYRHRLCVWDKDFNFLGLTNQFTFLDAYVEFCVGAAVYGEDLLVSFGFQDNAAFILKVPHSVVDELVQEALNAN